MTPRSMSLATAADTLAAIPALLGFTPDNSVVIIALTSDRNGAYRVAPTARVDAHQAEAAAGTITNALAQQPTPITAAIADTTHAGVALIGLDAICDALATAGIRTIRALHTYSLTAGTTPGITYPSCRRSIRSIDTYAARRTIDRSPCRWAVATPSDTTRRIRVTR